MHDSSIPSFSGQGASETPPLGIIAKLSSTVSASAHSPVEPLPSVSARVFRFALQGEARVLLPGERVAQCARRVIPGAGFVEVRGVPGSAYFQNLVRCGSVWHDPVCASKITEARRVELSAALATPYIYVALLTLTLRHSPADRLDKLLFVLVDGCSRGLLAGRFWDDLKAEYGILGTVRALETTHGLNGWHPHTHYLIVFGWRQDASSLAALRAEFSKRWLHVLARRGFDASWDFGVDLQDGDSKVAEYVAKFGREPVSPSWSIEHELAKAPVKRAAAGGRSPFQLLADSFAGDEVAGRLFVEYAHVFKGRCQLKYSKGLRALLGLGDEKSDDALTGEDDPEGDLLARLTRAQWKRVLGNDCRGELLDAASKGRAVLLVFLVEFGVIAGVQDVES